MLLSEPSPFPFVAVYLRREESPSRKNHDAPYADQTTLLSGDSEGGRAGTMLVQSMTEWSQADHLPGGTRPWSEKREARTLVSVPSACSRTCR